MSSSRSDPADGRRVLVTGGAGFIGCNLAARLAAGGATVRVFDNLARAGVEQNLQWLQCERGVAVEFVHGDVRDAAAVVRAAEGVCRIYHLAAQVAVTSSLEDPRSDFDTNLVGTFNVLEAARAQRQVPGIVFASTNKVYGALDDIALQALADRWQPVDPRVRERGIGESRPLDFHSPYGCSKGGADQYVRDYARCMGVPSVVLRMSCIYGPHQFGTEDQGWVAHFLLRALRGEPITLYGDGMQVRDVLSVHDAVEAWVLAGRQMDTLSGQAFNIGGGPSNTISLLQLLEWIAELTGREPQVERAAWRPGDQRYYVSDTRRFEQATGWRARIPAREGVADLHAWLRAADRRPLPAAPREKACLSGAC